LFLVLILVVMHFFPKRLSPTVHNLFDLDEEGNIPTSYSTMLLFSVSLGSLSIFIVGKTVLRSPYFWLLFSGVYCFLSLDEGAGLHEIIDKTTSLKWVYIYAPFALAFFLVCVYHVTKNGNRSLRNWILGGLIVYATGGLVLEYVGYWFWPLRDMLHQIEIVLEEELEMIGAIMVLTGCLHELNRVWGRDEPEGTERRRERVFPGP